MKLLIKRLEQTERRLDQLESTFNQCHDREAPSQNRVPDESNLWYPSPSHSSPRSQVWQELPDGGRILAPLLRDIGDDSRRTSLINAIPPFNHVSETISRTLHYLGKTPLFCEEQRLAFPDVVQQHVPVDIIDIPPIKQRFFMTFGYLYPLICDTTLSCITDVVQAQGFQQDVQSCLVLLVVALTKAFADVDSAESGLADYQRATQLRNQIGAQLSLQYVHVLVFSAMFLLRKDRLLDFAVALHTGCSMLNTVIKRYSNLNPQPRA